jgi:hypothetical protein
MDAATLVALLHASAYLAFGLAALIRAIKK